MLYAVFGPRRRWKRRLKQAEKLLEDGFQALVEKYPGFDPSKPRLVKEVGNDE
jgi:hypothetical protein